MHIIPNFGTDRIVAAVSCGLAWRENAYKNCSNENIGVCTKYFDSNDFENSLAATIALARFQSTFFGVRKMKL